MRANENDVGYVLITNQVLFQSVIISEVRKRLNKEQNKKNKNIKKQATRNQILTEEVS